MKTHARSHGLHTLDALIAATAIEEGLTLVSKNRKHLQMISDLKLEVPSYRELRASATSPLRSHVWQEWAASHSKGYTRRCYCRLAKRLSWRPPDTRASTRP